jgi:hypothetical protein
MGGWLPVALLGALLGAWAWAEDEVRVPSVLLLDVSQKNGALNLGGEDVLTVRKGDLIVNSSHSSAVFNANSRIEALGGAIRIVGGYNNLGEAAIAPDPTTGSAAMADPLTGIKYPPGGDVRSREKLFVSDGRETTLKPGYYAGGINAFGKGATLTLEPGMYVITDGDFFVGCGQFAGEGVTIVMSGQKPGKLTFGNGARGKLVAPKEGPLKDILIVSGGKAEGNNSDVGFNDARVLLQGTVYAPRGRIGVFFKSRVIAGHVVGLNLIMNTAATLDVMGVPVTSPAWDEVEVPE